MDDHAVVLKYLELRAERQAEGIELLVDEGRGLQAKVAAERARGEAMIDLLGLRPATADEQAPRRTIPALPAVSNDEWSALRDEARIALEAEGLDPHDVRLPPSEHRLDNIDVAAALAFGALGAVIPSLRTEKVGRGFVGDAFHDIQHAADRHQLPDLIQALFGRKPAPFMDAGAQGIFHRFCDGHDLLTALPRGASKLGWIAGPLEVFQHLLTDSFGGTGIPLPGSDGIGEAVRGIGGVSNLDDLISPRDRSRFASFRMTDVVASGVTSLLLWVYGKARNIPEGSMRRPKLGIVAHGLCVVGIAATAFVPGLQLVAVRRSHINYVSLAALAKNAFALRGLVNKATAANDADFARIRTAMNELERMRTPPLLPADAHRELALAATMMEGG